MKNKQHEKCVVITGSSGFLGSAISQKMKSYGYFVIGIDFRSGGDEFCDAFINVDLNEFVCSPKLQSEIFNNIKKLAHTNLISALVNNAAYQYVGSGHPIPLSEMTRSYYVNALAPYYLTSILSSDLEKNRGVVLNIGSIHARLTKANFSAYSSSKSALSSLTRSLAIDYGGRFRINAIEPAAIDTPMLRAGFSGDPSRIQELGRCHPSGQIGGVEEVAEMVAFLCSTQLEFMHGSCIDMSGGIGGRLHDPS